MKLEASFSSIRPAATDKRTASANETPSFDATFPTVSIASGVAQLSRAILDWSEMKCRNAASSWLVRGRKGA